MSHVQKIHNLQDTIDVDRYSRMLLLLTSFIMNVDSMFDYRLSMDVCGFKKNYLFVFRSCYTKHNVAVCERVSELVCAGTKRFPATE